MSVLSAQSIRELSLNWEAYKLPKACKNYNSPKLRGPLISPFVASGTVSGRSFGLSACSYDCRISDSLLIPVGQSRLAATIERFCIPTYICGSVLDKSTHARLFISAFNTHLDPGWEGFLTVELSNLGSEPFELNSGDPLVQIKFEWLDFPTELPYRGKYQDQPSGPQPARFK